MLHVLFIFHFLYEIKGPVCLLRSGFVVVWGLQHQMFSRRIDFL